MQAQQGLEKHTKIFGRVQYYGKTAYATFMVSRDKNLYSHTAIARFRGLQYYAVIPP